MAVGGTKLGTLLVELLMDDKGFTKGLADAKGKLAAAGKGMRQFATTVQTRVATAMKVGTAAMAAFATAATVVGSSFEQQMAKVAAISGATGDDFARLSERARELGASTEFTATQAGEALEALARAGLSVDESITAAGDALLLASTSGAELGESANLVAATMRQFGLDSGDTTRIIDVFSTAMRSSLLDFDSIREAMKFAGTTGAAFGMSIEETTAAVAAFRDLGLEGSAAGTAFRMSMLALTQVTDRGTKALRDLGLTQADVNPETTKFAEILEKIGDAGITATQAVAIFGKRAGANVAQLAAQVRTGELDIVALTEKLQESAGATADMYQTIGETVRFQTKIALSALQELFISTFELFGGPLREFIEGIPLLLNELSSSLQAQSGPIRAQFADLFGDLTGAVDDWRTSVADTFVNVIKLSLQVANALKPIAAAMLAVLSVAEELAVVLPAAFALATLARIAPIVTGIASAFGIATPAVTAFAGALTISTGGLFALMAAVGVVLVALTTYVTKIRAAKNETELLRLAQEKLSAASEALALAEEEELGRILDKQQKRIQDRLTSSEKLTGAQKRRLEAVLALTAETARLEKQQGRLIESGGELRFVEDLVTEGGGDAVLVIRSMADAADEAAEATRKQADALREDVVAFDAANTETEKRIALLAAGIKVDGTEIEVIQEKRAALAELDAQRQRESARAKNLRDEAAKARAGALQDELRAELAADRDRMNRAGAVNDDLVQKRREAADKIMAIEQSLIDDRLAATDDEIEQAALAQERKEADIRAAFDGLAALHRENADLVVEIERNRDEAIADSRRTFIIEGEEEVAEAIADSARESAEAREKAEKRGLAAFRDTLSERQRLEMELNELLREAAFETEEQRAAVVEKFTKEIEDLRKDEVREAIQEPGKLRRAWEDAMQKAGDAIKEKLGEGFLRTVDDIADFVKGAVKAFKEVGGAASDLFNMLTGGAISLDFGALTKDIMTAQEDATEAATDAGVKLAEAQAALTEAQQEAAEAGEDLTEAQQESLQNLQEAVTQAQLDLDAATEEAAKTTRERARDAAKEMAEQATAFAQNLAKAIGPFIRELTKAVPDIVSTLIQEIPRILMALVATIPDLIASVVEQIPDLIEGILVALPDIILRLAEEMPTVITAVVEAIPKIIVAIISNLPAIAFALLKALAIIPIELVKAIGEQFLKIIPDGVKALFDGLLGEWPQRVAEFVQTFFEGFVEKAKQIGKLIGNAILEIVTFGLAKTGGERKPKGERGGILGDVARGIGSLFTGAGQAGVPFVPATMRMTVHRGEAIVPADRNAQGVGGADPGAAGAPAAAGGGEERTIDIAIMAEGRLLDAVQVRAMKRGGAVRVAREIRRSSGARVGFSRGRFNNWGAP